MASRVFDLIGQEELRQATTVELIASENFVSSDVLRAVGSCLTNKYSEGYPAHRAMGNQGRYYGGCHIVDELEEYCVSKWKEVFSTDYHVNVQPHSGSSANLAAYMALLQPGDTVLSMSLSNGGHLTHGSPVNFSGKLYDLHFYDVDDDGFIDYDGMERMALALRPKLIIAGASAYSRTIDFARFAAAAQEVGACFMVDMAHIAGLVAAGEHPSPFGLADVITTTTHKTLRGPRGGLIFCRPELAKKVDSAVFPGTQGGPLQHVIAGKAVAAEEALTPAFRAYARSVVANCRAMAAEFMAMGYRVVTGGTDNHLFLLDLTDTGLTGKEVQEELDRCGITLNKNCVPGDRRSPFQTSGVRIGTAAMTTRGYTAEDFCRIARRIDEVIRGMMAEKAAQA
ncbi:MAG: serine hydroxymethyltransferase [Oscillospiraceae bacterium]|jgi:glycine hydroxymethyltransferase|uniref:serine hydroxymethyltransferase n=1 Tax=Dysosmobacter sp. TaxID=2591382 RepID=UPI002844EE33|nr:serine hydroxymethyltransferase [Oscillospiraceae bacterium]